MSCHGTGTVGVQFTDSSGRLTDGERDCDGCEDCACVVCQDELAKLREDHEWLCDACAKKRRDRDAEPPDDWKAMSREER